RASDMDTLLSIGFWVSWIAGATIVLYCIVAWMKNREAGVLARDQGRRPWNTSTLALNRRQVERVLYRGAGGHYRRRSAAEFHGADVTACASRTRRAALIGGRAGRVGCV